MTYRNSKTGGHAVKIVGVLAHGHDFGNDGFVSPLHAKHLGELLKILSRGFTNGEDGVAKPAHAKTAQLLIKEFYTELRCKQRNVFDDGKAHAPLLVFGKLYNCGKEGLGEKLNANNCAGNQLLFQARDDSICEPLLTDSSLEMMFNRTSGNSSLSI
jgi:hypothetical protein